MDLEDIVKRITTEKLTDIDVWDKIVHYFIQDLDGQHDIFEQIVILSRNHLRSQESRIEDAASYFRALESIFSDKMDLLEFLINIMGYLNYHTEQGSVNVKKCLLKYRKGLIKLQRECRKQGILSLPKLERRYVLFNILAIK